MNQKLMTSSSQKSPTRILALTWLLLFAGAVSSAVILYELAQQISTDTSKRIGFADELIDLNAHALSDFKTQIADWQDMLLHHYDHRLYAKSYQAFLQQKDLVQQDLSSLRRGLLAVGRDVSIIDDLRKKHEQKSGEYISALQSIPLDEGADNVRLLDKRVMNIDKQLEDLFEAAADQEQARIISFAAGESEKVISQYRGELILFLAMLSIVMPGGLLVSFMFINRLTARVSSQHEFLLTTLNSIVDAVIVIDRNQCISQMNPEAERLTAWRQEEAQGKSLGDVLQINDARTHQHIADPVETIRHQGGVVNLSDGTVLTARSGRKFFIAGSASSIQDDKGKADGVVITFRDITENKKILRDLQLSHAAVDKSQIPLFWLSPRGQVIDVNDSAGRSLGYKVDELIGKFIWDFDPDTRPEDMPPAWEKIKNDGIMTLERCHRRRDGTIFPVEVTANYVSYGDEEFIFTFAQDITDKKERERQNDFLTRIYAALFHSSQVLSECQSEIVLFDKICQIGVEFGGMAMAWIGSLDEVSGLIKPVASFGEGEAYLDEVVISARANLPEGRGPSGVAFREQRPVIIQDIRENPITQPWGDRARQYGFAGSAAFAILRGGKSYAVMNFYHRQANAFTGKIVELLGEMAKNVGHALDRFDLEEEGRKSYQFMEASANRFQNLVRASLDGFWMLDTQGRLLEVNDAYVERSGYTRDELLQMHVGDLEAAQDEAEIRVSIDSLVATGHARFESKHRAKDGSVWPLEVSLVYLSQEGGRIFAFFRDISERRQAEEDLSVAAKVFESQEAMMVTDAYRNIVRVNEAFAKITGYSAEEVKGRNPRLLQSGLHDRDFYKEMWSSINQHGSWRGEIYDKRKNGEIYPKWLTVSSVTNNKGIITHYVASFTDMTQYKQDQEKILDLAFYDQLTHLPNRRLLLERLERALAVSVKNKLFGAVLYFDLDHFKTINDTQGHDCGDMLLQETARRIQAMMSREDTIARVGGDEFVLLLNEVSADEKQAAAQAKQVGDKVLQVLARPYHLRDKEYPSSVSIGVTLYRGDDQDVHELLKRADMAMYEAKNAGRNTLRFFDPVMQETLERRTQLDYDLRHAMEGRQFQLYYQKRVGHGGRPRGAEVLLRWNHPQYGVVSPLDFIPLAEETGLIVPIGKWVLGESCRQLKKWQENEKTKDLMLSVNISIREFKQENFVDYVKQILSETGVNPALLALEITESMLLDNVEEFICKMNGLREVGVTFALDDFGTGYSSLSYLKRLPLNELKIDKSFVKDLGVDKNDEAIVQTIIQMGKTLGLEVIAEGVEQQAQCELLERYGCHNYQGYLFGKPVSLEAFEQDPAIGEYQSCKQGRVSSSP